MKAIRLVLNTISTAWDDLAMSIHFLWVMPLILGIGIAIMIHISMSRWDNNINNPANDAYVVEVAFNLDIEPWQVTQEQFNQRYKD